MQSNGNTLQPQNLTAFAEQDQSSIASETSDSGDSASTEDDYDSGSDSSASIDDHSSVHQDEDEQRFVDEYDDDDQDTNRDYREYKERPRYRLLTIASLSCLLLILLILLAFQLMEIYKHDNDTIALRDTAQPDDITSREKRSSRILDMLSSSYDPSKSNSISMDSPPSDNEEYKLPPDAARIYKHTSLSSKNYRAGGVLSDDMLMQYERDGVLVIRNLIPPQLLDLMDAAGDLLIQQEEMNANGGNRRGRQFHLVKHGAIFLGVPPPSSLHDVCDVDDTDQYALDTSTDDNDDNTTILSSFRDLAMYSKIPRVAASLLRLDELRVGGPENLNLGSKKSRERSRRRENETDHDDDYVINDAVNLRICRDIFLTKDDDPYACGWHVDDTGFWPSVAADAGVNAWVALDDMPWPWSSSHVVVDPSDRPEKSDTEKRMNHPPVATFALSLGSHRAPWRHEAYHITGSTHTQPPEGFQSAQDLIARRTGSGTCNIQSSAPDLYEKLEERKIVYDMKRGDVIFHDRWLFHRTVTVDEYNKMAGLSKEEFQLRNESNEKGKIFKRYSIRYSPGTARVPPGYGFELSALHNPQNANSTLDEIVERDGPFYPKVWPRVIKKKPSEAGYVEEIDGLTELVYDKLPRAERIQKERKKEVNRLLSRSRT
jgi:hypothetical protein